MSKNITETH